MKNYKIVLEFRVGVLGLDTHPDTLSKYIEDRLNSHSDGRHPFAVEVMHEALRKIVISSLECALDAGFREQHGNAMVSTKTGKPVKDFRRSTSATSLAGLLTERAMEKVSVYVRGEALCPKAAIVEDDQR